MNWTCDVILICRHQRFSPSRTQSSSPLRAACPHVDAFEKVIKNPLFKYPIRLLVFKLDFEKVEEPLIKLPTSNGSSKKQESSRKTSTSALLTMRKPLTVWIKTNCRKFLKRWEYQTTLLSSWEICMQVRKQQLELDMKQQTGSKSGKEYVKAVYCHPACVTYMQNTS